MMSLKLTFVLHQSHPSVLGGSVGGYTDSVEHAVVIRSQA